MTGSIHIQARKKEQRIFPLYSDIARRFGVYNVYSGGIGICMDQADWSNLYVLYDRGLEWRYFKFEFASGRHYVFLFWVIGNYISNLLCLGQEKNMHGEISCTQVNRAE